jgi:hypothetical protein
VSIENLLPSARPKFTEFAFEVIKPGQLWRLKEMDRPHPLSTIKRKSQIKRKKRDRKKMGSLEIDQNKIAPLARW